MQSTQQLYLHFIAQITYLIQEDGTAVGFDESARFVGQCAGKGALYVPEELRSGQFFGNRTAIDGYKRLVGTLAELVDAVSYVFFARSAGTIDEYRHIGR